MKKIIRLTESDLHRIIKDSVSRILKEDDYLLPKGGFDNAAYMYDDALDSDSLEDYDERMGKRKEYLDTAFGNGMSYHNQSPKKSVASTRYAHPEIFGDNGEDTLKDFSSSVEHYRKKDFPH